MSARKPVRKGDTFPEPTEAEPRPNPYLTALGPCFLRTTGKTKPRTTAWVYCRCSCGRGGEGKRKLYEVCRIRRNNKTGKPKTRSCGCYRETTIKENNKTLQAWRARQPSKWPLRRLRTKKILAYVDILDNREDDAVIKQTDTIRVRCKRCGKATKKPAVEIERRPDACDRCSGKEQWTLDRVRRAIKKKCVLLNDDGSEDKRPGATKVRLSDERYFRCLYCGHVGEPKKVFGQVKYRNSVCSECNPRKQWKLGRFRQLVGNLGGKVLALADKGDSFLIGCREKIRVECPLGHRDKKSPAHVLSQGTLCLECSAGLYERIVRAHFEAIFGTTFPKCRPAWLTRRMELDGFAKRLGLAFEHDGPQHYGKRIRRSQTPEQLKTIRELHELKDRLCRKNRITLIRIVSMNKIAERDALRKEILDKCDAANVCVPYPSATEKIVDAPDSIRIWQEVQQIVAKRGGKLQSHYYAGTSSKIMVSCEKEDHPPFPITPRKLRDGQWCRRCYDDSLLNSGALERGYKDNEEWLRAVLKNSGCRLSSKLPPRLCHRTKNIILRCRCGEIQKPKTFQSIVNSKTGGCCHSCKQKTR